MKKLICLLVVATVGSFVFTQPSKAQEMTKDGLKKTLYVEFEHSKYALLEPILAKFKFTIPSTDVKPQILKGISIRINFKGEVKEFNSLTSRITQGEPQPLPVGNIIGQLNPGEAQTLPVRNNNGQTTSAEIKFNDYEEEEIINRVEEFFPTPGNYQIQFFLFGYKGIASNIVNITIVEPKGINKEAFDFLIKYEDAMSFYWIWKEKDGEDLLEEFVNKYGESVYGESAISYLGNVYLAKGELDKAKAEFEKIKSSENSVIAKEANKSLADIARRKADLQNLEKQKEKPQ